MARTRKAQMTPVPPPSTLSVLDTLYAVHASERAAFGAAWCGPDHFTYGARVLVARYVPEADSDGAVAEVYCNAMPARFYRLVTATGMMRFGSDTEELVIACAKAIAEGMMDLQPTKGA